MIILFVFDKVYPEIFEISPHPIPLPQGERGDLETFDDCRGKKGVYQFKFLFGKSVDP
jgi:hypothetical protein